MEVWVGRRRIVLKPEQLVGRGAEADVFAADHGVAIKLYRIARDLARTEEPERLERARRRLERAEAKLSSYPRGLDRRVIAPLELVRETTAGRVVGYTMRLVSGASPLVRWASPEARSRGTTARAVTTVFAALREILLSLHAAGVVVGDLNDLNVLVAGLEPYLIDADSYQFGPFVCDMFTERFVDPRICDPHGARPRPVRPYDQGSDWYAFHVLLFHALTGVTPFSGVHRPADPVDWVPQGARALERISVLHPEVQAPRAAMPPEALGARLLSHFDEVFHRDLREPPPEGLLDSLNWSYCNRCGLEHASPRCPRCRPRALASVAAARESGEPERTPAPWTGLPSVLDQSEGPRFGGRTLVRTTGRVLAVQPFEERLGWLIWEEGRFVRETGEALLEGPLQPQLAAALAPDTTLIAVGERALRIERAGACFALGVENCEGRPQIGSDGRTLFWIAEGWLCRQGAAGAQRLLPVAPRRTRCWIERGCGLLLTDIERPAAALVFDPESTAAGSPVALAPLVGHWFDVGAVFGHGLWWVFVIAREAGRDVGHALVFDCEGRQLAAVSGEPEAAPWLSSGARGCRSDRPGLLLVPTDEGVAELVVREGGIEIGRVFERTRPLVHAQTRLLRWRRRIVAIGGFAVHDLGELG